MSIPDFRADGWLPEGHYSTNWDDIIARFGGGPASRRANLMNNLIEFRDRLKARGCIGYMVLDGSFISRKPAPDDFDVLLVLQDDIQAVKDSDPTLARLLDTEMCERRDGLSVFYAANNSPAIEALTPLWDYTAGGVVKGVVEVHL